MMCLIQILTMQLHTYAVPILDTSITVPTVLSTQRSAYLRYKYYSTYSVPNAVPILDTSITYTSIIYSVPFAVSI